MTDWNGERWLIAENGRTRRAWERERERSTPAKRRFSAFSRRAKIGRPVKIDRRRQRGDLYRGLAIGTSLRTSCVAIKGIGFRMARWRRRSARASRKTMKKLRDLSAAHKGCNERTRCPSERSCLLIRTKSRKCGRNIIEAYGARYFACRRLESIAHLILFL